MPRNHVILKILPLCAFFGLVTTLTAAQEAEEQKGWTQSAEVSLVATSGNSDATTFALKYDLGREWAKSRLKLAFSGLRAESDTGRRIAVGTSPDEFTVIDPDESEVTAENYSANGRFERDVSKRFFWFAGGGWERNEFAGVRNRFVAEAGGGNTWFKSEKTHLLTDYALTGTHEEDVVRGPEDSETFLGVRLSLDYMRQLSKTTAYTGKLVVDENLDETSDLRANLDQAIAVSINKRLALKASLQVLFDNDPSLEALPLFLPDGSPSGEIVLARLDDVDTIFKTALVIDF